MAFAGNEGMLPPSLRFGEQCPGNTGERTPSRIHGQRDAVILVLVHDPFSAPTTVVESNHVGMVRGIGGEVAWVPDAALRSSFGGWAAGGRISQRLAVTVGQVQKMGNDCWMSIGQVGGFAHVVLQVVQGQDGFFVAVEMQLPAPLANGLQAVSQVIGHDFAG